MSPMRITTHTAATLLATLVAACGGGEPPTVEAPVAGGDLVELTVAQVASAGIVTAPVAARAVRPTVRVPGSIQSPDTARASVGSIVDGRVVAVRVLAGDRVRAGQSLVEIHAHELADAQRDLSAAEAELRFRRNAFERSERLLTAGAVSLEEVERRRADMEAAQAEVIRSSDIVAHLNPSSAGDVRIVAPSDGTIFSVAARVGQAVLAGEPLVEMGATRSLWVTAYVPEQTAVSLVLGDTVAVSFNTTDERVGARLIRAGDFVDPANRSVEMRFALNRIPSGIRPGSFAVVEVATSGSVEGVEVGADVAVRLGDDDIVFVAEGPGRYRAIPVTVVPLGADRIAVRGIPSGSELVVEGAYSLKAALELVGAGEGGES